MGDELDDYPPVTHSDLAFSQGSSAFAGLPGLVELEGSLQSSGGFGHIDFDEAFRRAPATPTVAPAAGLQQQRASEPPLDRVPDQVVQSRARSAERSAPAVDAGVRPTTPSPRRLAAAVAADKPLEATQAAIPLPASASMNVDPPALQSQAALSPASRPNELLRGLPEAQVPAALQPQGAPAFCQQPAHTPSSVDAAMAPAQALPASCRQPASALANVDVATAQAQAAQLMAQWSAANMQANRDPLGTGLQDLCHEAAPEPAGKQTDPSRLPPGDPSAPFTAPSQRLSGLPRPSEASQPSRWPDTSNLGAGCPRREAVASMLPPRRGAETEVAQVASAWPASQAACARCNNDFPLLQPQVGAERGRCRDVGYDAPSFGAADYSAAYAVCGSQPYQARVGSGVGRILPEPASTRLAPPAAQRARASSPAASPVRAGRDAPQQDFNAEVLSQIASALTSLAAAQGGSANKTSPFTSSPQAVGACSAPPPIADGRTPQQRGTQEAATGMSPPAPMRPGPRAGGNTNTRQMLDWQKEIRDMVLSAVTSPQACPASARSPSPARPSSGPLPTDKVPMVSKSVQAQNAELLPFEPADDSGRLPVDERVMVALRRDFQGKLQTLRAVLHNELLPRREDMIAAVQSIESQRAMVRQRCAEAEREARAEFDGLRSHLASLESLKQAIFGRERDIRCSIADGIEDVAAQVQAAERAGLSPEAMDAFVRAFPELQAVADTLWSRAASLPEVEVSMEDIPFEARTRADKLRQLAVVQHVLGAKDSTLWRLEQQRRQLAMEAHETASWMRQLEALLERYAEELSHTCYFCAERFSAATANTRCTYNVYAGHVPAPDTRVPPNLWGAGVHFWVPQALVGEAPPGLANARLLLSQAHDQYRADVLSSLERVEQDGRLGMGEFIAPRLQ